jgi:RHS repeat-associated protein
MPTRTQSDGPYSQGYDYDVWGNVTHKYGWGGEVQGGTAGQSSDIYYTYTNNRRNGFSYDAAGNLTNDLGQTFTYDATGQQATASYMSVLQSYDGNGLRVKKTENGQTTYYLRSSVLGGQVVAEMDSSGSWTRGYVYLGGSLLAVQDSAVYWMHEDPVTKSKRVTDASGTIVSTVELDPWGADTSRSSNAAFQPRKFTSYERDANGTDEAMFRRYNRWQSRFDQPDPYDGSYSIGDPQSFNRYAYTQNDPVNFVDPSGLMQTICGYIENANGDGGHWACVELWDWYRWGGLESGGGKGTGPEPPQNPAPTPRPEVDKLYGWWGPCNRSANDLMRTIRSDFSKFGNFAEPVAGGTAVAGIHFDSGPITLGRVIGITVGAVSTVNPSLSYSQHVSVTVNPASTMGFTFITNPGHFFYPGTISFSARDTTSNGASAVEFQIKAQGQLNGATATLGYYGGGGDFEDDAWKGFLAKVRTSCGNK